MQHLDPHKLNTACIGLGVVGRAWAVVFAKAGSKVALFDTNKKEIEKRALPAIKDTLELLDGAGLLSEAPEKIVGRIHAKQSIEDAVRDAHYVQESVREDVEIKRDVFAEIAAYSDASCILASSTSALKGSDFLGAIPNPERALVAHPVNPPSVIPLVELCGSMHTNRETISAAKQLLAQMGMQPIVVKKEIDGFILNRLQYTLVAEAMHLVGEGYCDAEDIDRVMTQGLALRWASIGPFETAHLNSTNGFRGFVDQLGPMMKQMGRSARTDYDWDDRLADAVHQGLVERCPVSSIPGRQRWRDSRILATRRMQGSTPADE